MVNIILLMAVIIPILCNGARILAFLPLNSFSHFSIVEPLLLELHKRGHHLTVVSSFPQKIPLENFTDIDMSSQNPPLLNIISTGAVKEKQSNSFKSIIVLAGLNTAVCENVLRHEEVLNLFNKGFELVIGEIFGSDCANYIAYKLKVPFISLVTSNASPWTSSRTGLPDNPSYIPNFLVEYVDEMTFYQRSVNSVTYLCAIVLYQYHSYIPTHRLAEVAFKEELPFVDEVNRQTSLVLVNSHPVVSQSRPFPPNVVEVAGIHIRQTRPLPEDIKQFLDNAREGAILMTLGSLVRVSSLPPRVVRILLDVFAALPQRVIIKYEDELLDPPSNVMAKKWLHQADIIAHPNVRAVITHGGLATTIEAVHFGKPLLVTPIFGDQRQNANNLVRRGGAISIDILNISERDFSNALSAVLNDPSYTKNMQRLSQQFRDRPMTPLQTAVYWTEYVIRHKGAPHLRPASVGLPLYQYLLLDVIAVLLISAGTVFFIAYKFIRIIINRLCYYVSKHLVYKNIKVQ